MALMGTDARLGRTVMCGVYSAVALALYFPYFLVNTFCLSDTRRKASSLLEPPSRTSSLMHYLIPLV